MQSINDDGKVAGDDKIDVIESLVCYPSIFVYICLRLLVDSCLHSLDGHILHLDIKTLADEVLLHCGAAVNHLLVDRLDSKNDRMTTEKMNAETPTLPASDLTKSWTLRLPPSHIPTSAYSSPTGSPLPSTSRFPSLPLCSGTTRRRNKHRRSWTPRLASCHRATRLGNCGRPSCKWLQER